MMDLFNMEELLGPSWVPEQTFDCFHFDDVKGSEAEDGLMELSIKSETLADTPMDMLQELSPTAHDGPLDMEWMEQSNILQLLDVTIFDGSVAEPVLQLEEDFVFNLPSVDAVKSEPDTQERVSVDEFLQNLLKPPADPAPQNIKVEAALSPAPSSPDAQVAPEVDFAVEDGTSLDVVLGCQFLQSPLSPDDVESVLSSACSPTPTPPPPASPDASSQSSTVDAACLYSDEGSWSLSSSDLYKVVENTEKSRSTPYSKPQKQQTSKSSKSKGRKLTASISPNPSDLELELMSKKDRKKLQNKNAAIRYRMKKKDESDQKRTEVDELESINQSLREKFEELTQEVKYMKDLIGDVRSAQGLPSLAD